MRVCKKLTRWDYFTDRQFVKKKPRKEGTYEQTQGDNQSPGTLFEKYEQFALVSSHFYYFGANAIWIPRQFDLEKNGPGFRSHFDPTDIKKFLRWLENRYTPGKYGDPVCQDLHTKESRKCKSSC